MKKIALLTVFCCLALFSSAQFSYGIKFGSSLSFDKVAGNSLTLYMGGTVEYQLAPQASLQGELLYSRFKMSYQMSETFAEQNLYISKAGFGWADYLMLPLMIKLMNPEKWLSFDFGVQFAFPFNVHETGTSVKLILI